MACLPILFYFLGSKIPKKKDDPAKEKTRLQSEVLVQVHVGTGTST